MDPVLRCNDLKCRTQLNGQAVVTTCSHIFCLPCSERLSLTHPDADARTCPACHTPLGNPDDAVVAQLNPTEDYKTSVLSGLSPTLIMECAGRALAFFTYQTTQEILYQETLARSLTDKYAMLSGQMDKLIHDANTEIHNMREKMRNMQAEQKVLIAKNTELANAYKEKAKIQQGMQKRLMKIQHQQNTIGHQRAAEQDADQVLEAINAGHYGHSSHRSGQPVYSRGSNGSHGSGDLRDTIHAWERRANNALRNPTRPGGAVVGMPSTPSAQRMRLTTNVDNTTTSKRAHVDASRNGSSHRQALGGLDPNVYHAGSNGYMPSAGKYSRSAGGPVGHTNLGPGINVGRGSMGGYVGR